MTRINDSTEISDLYLSVVSGASQKAEDRITQLEEVLSREPNNGLAAAALLEELVKSPDFINPDNEELQRKARKLAERAILNNAGQHIDRKFFAELRYDAEDPMVRKYANQVFMLQIKDRLQSDRFSRFQAEQLAGQGNQENENLLLVR